MTTLRYKINDGEVETYESDLSPEQAQQDLVMSLLDTQKGDWRCEIWSGDDTSVEPDWIHGHQDAPEVTSDNA